MSSLREDGIMPKYIINYTRHGNPINDFYFGKRDLWFTQFLDEGYNEVSTQNAIDRIRLAVASEELSLDDVEIRFEDEPVNMNKYGAISPWPEGFCETSMNLVGDLLTHQVMRQKAERKAREEVGGQDESD
jgi:hypothetical protein